MSPRLGTHVNSNLALFLLDIDKLKTMKRWLIFRQR